MSNVGKNCCGFLRYCSLSFLVLRLLVTSLEVQKNNDAYILLMTLLFLPGG
jgi:hypothetical protein